MSAIETPVRGPSGEDWLNRARGEIDERHRVARRHSIFVGILKIALPVLSVLGVIGFIGYVYLVPELPPGISIGSVDIDGNSIVMQDPHVSGFMSGGRSYELRADKAQQSLENTKVVTLHNIGATIGLGDGQTARVKADRGTYYTDVERMVLDNAITLETTTGIHATLASADIDMKAGTMHSEEPLQLASQGSMIKANNIEIRDRGKSISFRNGVKVTYALNDESNGSIKPAAKAVTE